MIFYVNYQCVTCVIHDGGGGGGSSSIVALGTSHIYENLQLTVALSISYLVPCFATFSCFFHNGPLPGLPQSSSPFGSLQIPIQCAFFKGFIPVPKSVTNPLPFSHSDL